MPYIKKMEFGNYTLNFGDDNVLLDFFDEIVMPSFHEMKYVRRLKERGEYFFIDTQVINLSGDCKNPVLGISGKIVKNTKLKRDQIFRTEGGLIDDKQELETAPSSTFLLILNNHRLILSKEVPGAPSIKNFESTSQYCLRESQKDFVNQQYNAAKLKRSENPELDVVTKKSLFVKYPAPRLRITPLSDTESLKDFVARFKQIDTVSIKLLPTNREEIDNDAFWVDLGRRREEMNSNAARVEFANSKDGLDSDQVLSQASSASNYGNSEVRLSGSDNSGDTLRGTNEDFSLSVDFDELSRDSNTAAHQKYGKYQHLVNFGVITVPAVAADVLLKVKSIFDRL
ncbi:hypothetical protein MK852_01220 [Shewanella benthica]|nr:hypothetical protein [Shewanella benthica]